VNEILYLSNIKGNKKVKNLCKKDCKKILINLRKVFVDVISKGGSFIRNFKNIFGKKGGF